MNRAHWQQLAEDRALEAKTLLDAGLWSGAYYLIGYAVECALKACVLLRVERSGVIFEDKRFSERCWTHDLKELIKLAGLESECDNAISTDPSFELNLQAVITWDEASRYKRWTEPEARDLYEAVSDASHGVLQWIKMYW